MKIAVFGLGYVSLSNAVLLAQHNEVVPVDITPARVEILNARKSPIVDKELEEFLVNEPLNLTATLDPSKALVDANHVIVATPTNYDVDTNKFDTSSVEAVIKTDIAVNKTATIIVKSTIPVGFVVDVRTRLGTDQVIFSPDFLGKGRALYDKLEQHVAEDFVIATGVQYSIREFITWSATHLGITLKFEGEGVDEIGIVDSVTGDDAIAIKPDDVIVRIDPRYFCPAEVETPLGDLAKAKERLGWAPEISVQEMCAEMVASDLKVSKRHALLKAHGYELPVSLDPERRK